MNVLRKSMLMVLFESMTLVTLELQTFNKQNRIAYSQEGFGREGDRTIVI